MKQIKRNFAGRWESDFNAFQTTSPNPFQCFALFYLKCFVSYVFKFFKSMIYLALLLKDLPSSSYFYRFCRAQMGWSHFVVDSDHCKCWIKNICSRNKLLIRSSYRRCFIKEDVLKNFAKYTFFGVSLKKDSDAGFDLQILQNY